MPSARLGWLLARSWQVKAGALIIAMTALLLIVVFGVVRYLDTPSRTIAATTVGDAGFSLNLPYSWTANDAKAPLVSNAIDKRMVEEGALGARIGYVGGSTGVEGIKVWVEEHNWAAEPFPDRFSDVKGALPSRQGEIAVSNSVARVAPIGSTVTIFGDTYSVQVVGTFRDEAARSADMVMLGSGTLEHILENNASQLATFDLSFTPVLYWSGSSPEDVTALVASEVAEVTGAPVSADQLIATVASRAALEAEPATSLGELSVALVLAPLAVALVAGLLSGRFLRRVRQTLFAVGVYRTVVIGVGTVSLVAVVASAIGSLLGVLVAVAIRPLIDSVAPTELGDLFGLFPVAVVGAICTLVATVCTLVLVAPAERRKRVSTRSFSRAIPWTVGGALALVGVVLSVQPDVNLKIVGTICVGLVGVVLLPLLLSRFREAAGPPIVVLALRRIGEGGAATAGVVSALAASLLIGITMMTLYHSDSVSFDATQIARVPAGQAFFESHSDDGAVRDRVTAHLDTAPPIPLSFTEGSVIEGLGATLTVKSAAELESVLGRALMTPERDLLNEGGMLRSQKPPASQVQYEGVEGHLTTVDAMLLTDIPPSYELVDGFILTTTAETLGVGAVRTVYVYTNLSDGQVELAANAPKTLGFDPEWLEVNMEPSPYSQPFTLTLFVFAILLLGGAIVGAYSAASARALRPRVAGLLSIGLPAKWLTQARLFEVMSVTLAALLVAVVSGLGAAFLAVAFGVFRFQLHIPVPATAATMAGILMLAFLVTIVSSSRLVATERFD